MTSLKALIIDDEPLAHKVILEYAKDVPFLDIVGQAYLATEALNILRNQEVDLLFLDIQMPKLLGLEFLRTLSHPPIVIITSAYAEYALESYELNVCDYLQKPFRFNRFLQAVNKATELHQMKRSPITNSVKNKETRHQIFIKVEKRLIQVNTNNIEFLESYGNYVKVWLADSFHLTPRTLSSFEPQLPADRFLRIHKSYIINQHSIDYLEGNFIMMKNGKQLAIGKSHRTEVKRILSSHQ